MTVAKFKVVIRTKKLSKSTNEAPVCLRITKDRKSPIRHCYTFHLIIGMKKNNA